MQNTGEDKDEDEDTDENKEEDSKIKTKRRQQNEGMVNTTKITRRREQPEY